MRIAYFDCASGIAGDMTLAALVDAGVPLAEIQAGIDSLGIKCRLIATEVKRHGFRATHVAVEHEPEHAHRHLHHITDMIDASALSEPQKTLAKRIFTRLGEAEAKVHGTTIRKVHFHEVGAVDSIADVVGSAIGLIRLGVDRFVCSPVATGRGYIEIAHGRCSIPAPATAELLTGVPIAASEVEAELCTPTGAAIVATVAESFGGVPAMTIEKIGYGAGTRELAVQPNLVRLLVGQTTGASESADTSDRVYVVETNLDDASGETIGYAIERLWQAGALEVYTTAIGMKKNRPGIMLSVICDAGRLDAVERVLLGETPTLGLRRTQVQRRKLPRTTRDIDTPWGPVEAVVAALPDGRTRTAPEYEACRRVATEREIPLTDVYQAVQRAVAAGGG
jgi:uncharacterized protein (TIGR00299 family) protein